MANLTTIIGTQYGLLPGFSFAAPATIGNVTANTGAFTTLTASANVNFDSGTFFVDGTNNRVGVNTTDPGYSLDVAATDTTAGLGYAIRIRANTTAGAGTLQFTDNPVTTEYGFLASSASTLTLSTVGNTVFRAGNAERFRITNTGAITSSDLADAVGYKGVPQNAQTAQYTLALSDIGKHISITTGGIVIPANGTTAFPIGSTIVVFNNSGSTQTITITTDTLRQAGTTNTGTRTLAVYGLATLVKVAATVWVVSGNVT